MEKAPGRLEKRKYPRFFLDLPLEFREFKEPCSRGGLVVNVSEGGVLIESVKSLPLNTQLNIVILFPNQFELTGYKLITRVVRKEPFFKEDWEGFQYGLAIIQVLDEDLWKKRMILKGQLEMEKVIISNEEVPKPKIYKQEVVDIQDKTFFYYNE